MPVMQEKESTDIQSNNDGEIAYIDSRFGRIKINLNKQITFQTGLLGIPDKLNFCLANFPNPKFNRFKILQSVEDDNLAFIVLPLHEDIHADMGALIAKEDIEACCNACKLNVENIAILLITCVHRSVNQDGIEEVSVSVNARAPLIIDISNNTGIQYVFHNNKYLVRQPIQPIFNKD
jgi:flagellar assembly factor FliW